jgi:glucose-1-phosphate cytidylyltransferase
MDYIDLEGHLTLSLRDRQIGRQDCHTENWIIHLMDTGQRTETGGRLKRLWTLVTDGTFMMTEAAST